MDWQQKFDALDALSETSIKKDVNRNWYVSMASTWIGGDGFLTGETGRGKTPEEAVNNHWDKYVTSLPHNKFIVIEKYKNRKHVRWNGFMWNELPQQTDSSSTDGLEKPSKKDGD